MFVRRDPTHVLRRAMFHTDSRLLCWCSRECSSKSTKQWNSHKSFLKVLFLHVSSTLFSNWFFHLARSLRSKVPPPEIKRSVNEFEANSNISLRSSCLYVTTKGAPPCSPVRLQMWQISGNSLREWSCDTCSSCRSLFKELTCPRGSYLESISGEAWVRLIKRLENLGENGPLWI